MSLSYASNCILRSLFSFLNLRFSLSMVELISFVLSEISDKNFSSIPSNVVFSIIQHVVTTFEMLVNIFLDKGFRVLYPCVMFFNKEKKRLKKERENEMVQELQTPFDIRKGDEDFEMRWVHFVAQQRMPVESVKNKKKDPDKWAHDMTKSYLKTLLLIRNEVMEKIEETTERLENICERIRKEKAKKEV